jgi:hypothetical protein
MEAKDREQLVMFVDSMREDLPFIFDVSERSISPEVYKGLWPAWEALLARGEFEGLREAVASGDYDERLERVGLSGPELDFKLAGYETARAAGREKRAPRPSRGWRRWLDVILGSKASRGMRAPRPLRPWLRWIDVILGSLLSAVGVGEGIKELKEGVEAELDSEQEESP